MRILTIVLLGLLLTASSLNDARKANDAFKSGDYETAIELYRQAIEENPEDHRLHFNLGTALAQTGNAEESVKAFQRAKQLMDDPRQQAMADYNAGTILSKAEMYDEALTFFKEALRKNPDDPDTKHNYEMSVQKQQEQEEQEQDSDSDEQDENEDQEQEQNQDDNEQNEQEQDQDQEQNQDQDQQNDQNEGSPEDQEADAQQQPQPDEISREEARNILNALEQLERQILENRKKEASDSQSSNDKDW